MTSEPQEARQLGAAKTQNLFRHVNERLEAINRESNAVTETVAFVCECSDERCTDQIEMALEDYESLRSTANRFAIMRGHEQPDVEGIVEENDAYVVVEKAGAGGVLAARTDPRGSGGEDA